LFFNSKPLSFELTFLNKCDPVEQDLIAELYQRVFNEELRDSAAAMFADS
jgi:cobaltochelatase CobS